MTCISFRTFLYFFLQRTRARDILRARESE